MGVDVAITDIDIAHRVPSRSSESSGPKPIICKFVRRLSREDVMALRNEVRNIDPIAVGLDVEADLSKALIIDHLSPKKQDLFLEAKKFRKNYKYAYCWAKNSIIYLRRSQESRPIKVKDVSVLLRLAQEEMETNLTTY